MRRSVSSRSAASRFLTVALSCALGSSASAQSYPDKPITLVVPFAPGASADGIARVLARELTVALGQQVIVDNKPGAGGATALIAVSKAPADGYTLAMGAAGAIAIGPDLPDSPPLDPERQLQPVAKLADIPLVVVTNAKTGLPTLQSALDKARTSDVPTGNTGAYTAQHLAAELLASATKTHLPAVPYRGSAPAVTDVLGGQLQLAVVDLTSAYAQVKAGNLRALGVTSPDRSKVAPEIPTIAEAGVPGYSATAWMGLFLPRGAPAPVLDRLSKEVEAALARPEVQGRIIALAAEPAYLDAPSFSRFIAEESKKWKGVIASIPTPQK
jgi:tripartite-type tricarboxylate transporter receptor subunit TctC